MVMSCRECVTEPENEPDTTSHNFTWEIDTIGNYGSYLKDIAIVNENNIWAVGRIKTDSGTFNAAKWDGNIWRCLKIIDVMPLYSISYFSENDIWVTTFGLPIHWDGNSWTLYHIQNMGISASVGFGIWSTSSCNIYFVGAYGSIVHYDGQDFTKMESGTKLNLNAVYGSANGDHIFAVGYNDSGELSGRSIALENDGSKWTPIFQSDDLFPSGENNILGRIYSVWVYGDTLFLPCKAGVWKESLKNGKGLMLSQKQTKTTGTVINRIRGNHYYDILMADIWGDIIHYNGVSWYIDKTIYNQFPNGQINVYSMDYKERLCAVVGHYNYHEHALVIKGYRN